MRTAGCASAVPSTRSMRPTEAGQRYLGYARQALEALDEGAESLGQDRTELAGTIRIAATSDLGRHILRPWLDAFCDEHPGVRVTLVLGDRLPHRNAVEDDVPAALPYIVPDAARAARLAPLLPAAPGARPPPRLLYSPLCRHTCRARTHAQSWHAWVPHRTRRSTLHPAALACPAGCRGLA